MLQFEVDFFKKADGSCPVMEFLDSLDVKMRAKIARLILLLENNGNGLREPYSKALGEGIYELRAIQGNNITRVLYFFISGNKIILTNGFIKKTQRTPQAELDIAKRYRIEYLNRKGDC